MQKADSDHDMFERNLTGGEKADGMKLSVFLDD